MIFKVSCYMCSYPSMCTCSIWYICWMDLWR